MSDKEKIQALEKEIAELKDRLRAVESRPFVVINTPTPVWQPTPTYPVQPAFPWWGETT